MRGSSNLGCAIDFLGKSLPLSVLSFLIFKMWRVTESNKHSCEQHIEISRHITSSYQVLAVIFMMNISEQLIML